MTTLDLGRDVLAANDDLAAALRQRFADAGVHVVNVLSSPGSGKTTLLTALLTSLTDQGVRAAAIVGDCATDNDAVRLAASGAPVVQVVTDGTCHLEAAMVADHLAVLAAEHDAPVHDLDVLFVENVGNLVCPAGFDLGETERWVLLSVTEGEDKPLKYPAAFASADLAVLTKTDLAVPCEFDETAARDAVATVAGQLPVVACSARDGTGLTTLLARLRRAPVAA